MSISLRGSEKLWISIFSTPITETDCGKIYRREINVYLNGTIYVARDAAHKRNGGGAGSGEKNFRFPYRTRRSIIWGLLRPEREDPSVPPGPTTASRMDKYTPRLLDLGLKAMVGKGKADKRSAGRGCTK